MSANDSSAFTSQVKQFTLKMNSLEAIDERMTISNHSAERNWLMAIRTALTSKFDLIKNRKGVA
jgi:hypothetical protein